MTVSSSRPIRVAHPEALAAPLAIMKRAWNRSRVRGWAEPMANRRKSSTL
jgi:hypothetical protein